MAALNGVNNDGLDLRQFNRELVDYLRCLLLVKTGAAEAVDLTTEDINDLKELADQASLSQILNAVKLFGQIELGNNDCSTLPLELALVDCYLGEKLSPVQTPGQKVLHWQSKLLNFQSLNQLQFILLKHRHLFRRLIRKRNHGQNRRLNLSQRLKLHSWHQLRIQKRSPNH
jgi:DNA polymerase III gamma/tau subunit